MSNQMAPGPSPTTQATPPKQTERPHPLTPVIRGWVALVAIAFVFARQALEGSNGDGGGGLLSLGVWVIVLIVLGTWY